MGHRTATTRELEIRSNNRYHLHPLGKKQCTQCEEIYDNIQLNFNIHHKNKNGDYVYEGQCKACRAKYAALLKKRQKQDGNWYFQRLLSGVKCRAKKERVEFSLTSTDLQEAWEAQDGRCYYTNQPMDLMAHNEDRKSPHYNFPSLDRKIPNKGYIKENVVWTKWSVNRTKNNLTEKEFIEMCKGVVRLHG